mgnify:FL=1
MDSSAYSQSSQVEIYESLDLIFGNSDIILYPARHKPPGDQLIRYKILTTNPLSNLHSKEAYQTNRTKASRPGMSKVEIRFRTPVAKSSIVRCNKPSSKRNSLPLLHLQVDLTYFDYPYHAIIVSNTVDRSRI